jgi:NitT/TauT family transport system substrate-binding protein
VHASLVEECPELSGALKEGLPRAKDWIFANREEAGELASRTLGTKPQVFARSLDHFNIQVASGKAMKAELAAFYQTLLDSSPDALGGKLPGDEFYLDL